MARKRSEAAHRKVLDATFTLMSEKGIDATSMDAIAEASGVSKATIYKHWTDKEALLLEMVAEINGLHTRPTFDSGNTRSDMVAVLSYRPEEKAELRERIMPHFMAYSARNPSFSDTWRDTVMEPPRRELSHLLRLGITRGELSPKLDLDLSLALLLGPIMYWYVFLKRYSAKPDSLAEGVIDAFWRAYGLSKNSTRSARNV